MSNASWFLHDEKTGRAVLRDNGELIYEGLYKDMPEDIRRIANQFQVPQEEVMPILFGCTKNLPLTHKEAAFLLVLLCEEPTIKQRMAELQYSVDDKMLEILTNKTRRICWDFIQLPEVKNEKT